MAVAQKPRTADDDLPLMAILIPLALFLLAGGMVAYYKRNEAKEIEWERDVSHNELMTLHAVGQYWDPSLKIRGAGHLDVPPTPCKTCALFHPDFVECVRVKESAAHDVMM